MTPNPIVLLAIAAGGAAGAVGRFALDQWVQRASGSSFPYGTLAVNVVGCLAIGFCFAMFEQRGGPMLRMAIMSGLIGAFTTFSTYSLDAIHLIHKGNIGGAAAYLAASVVLGLLATVLGIGVARAIF